MTSEVEKSNFYKDLEEVIDWKESEIKSEKQNENEVKQKREWRSRSHSRFVLVTLTNEKSNFYKDLSVLMDIEFVSVKSSTPKK